MMGTVASAARGVAEGRDRLHAQAIANPQIIKVQYKDGAANKDVVAAEKLKVVLLSILCAWCCPTH
jgi:hypothetical protein